MIRDPRGRGAGPSFTKKPGGEDRDVAASRRPFFASREERRPAESPSDADLASTVSDPEALATLNRVATSTQYSNRLLATRSPISQDPRSQEPHMYPGTARWHVGARESGDVRVSQSVYKLVPVLLILIEILISIAYKSTDMREGPRMCCRNCPAENTLCHLRFGHSPGGILQPHHPHSTLKTTATLYIIHLKVGHSIAFSKRSALVPGGFAYCGLSENLRFFPWEFHRRISEM